MNADVVERVKRLTDGLRPRAKVYVTLKNGNRRRVQSMTREKVMLLLGGNKGGLPWSDVVGVEVKVEDVGLD